MLATAKAYPNPHGRICKASDFILQIKHNIYLPFNEAQNNILVSTKVRKCDLIERIQMKVLVKNYSSIETDMIFYGNTHRCFNAKVFATLCFILYEIQISLCYKKCSQPAYF